uniref:Uncharacterized protein n=1 Tax=Podoviridae sp. ctZkC8 TaxID=2825259 RepID=A0A8S5UBG0_9CAUD|nr:MAG TPA: hypothetical protein [Podoviridae sp. ctZkC8]
MLQDRLYYLSTSKLELQKLLAFLSIVLECCLYASVTLLYLLEILEGLYLCRINPLSNPK